MFVRPAAKRLTVEERRAVHRQQAKGRFVTAWLNAILGSVFASLFYLGFTERHPATRTGAYSLMLVLYALLALTAMRWLRSGDDRRFLSRTGVLSFLVGVCWSVLALASADGAVGPQNLVILGLIMALTAASIVGSPVSAGLAFFVPIAVSGLILVVALLPPVGGIAIACFVGFLTFCLFAMIYVNSMITNLSIGRLELERRHETIKVFLREYEDGSNDWLWATDVQGRFVRIDGREGNATPAIGGTGPATSFEAFATTAVAAGLADGSDLTRLATSMRVPSAFRDLRLPGLAGGELSWLSVTGHPVFENGVFTGFRGIASDVTKAKAVQDQIEFLARHDGLTGLLNRRAFVEHVDKVCSSPNASRYMMLLVDLDDFKTVNDSFGHHVGDGVIREIGERIKRCGAAWTVAARLGGDEFAILYDRSGERDPVGIADRFLVSLAGPITVGEIRVEAGVSIGVALCPEHASGSEALLRIADIALYCAKDRDKGRYQIFETGMELRQVAKARQQAELRQAIEEEQIGIDYQPIFDVVSETLVSMEALARWNHPVDGKLAAGSFIPLAESSDLIFRLGSHILRKACSEAARWERSVSVSVNVSARQLRSPDFIGMLGSILSDTGLPPRRLALEVTETVFVAPGSQSISQLAAIRALGVRVILDDFGTGYSSMAYLRRFTVDGLKIDQSFTRELPDSRRVGAIVRSLTGLAAELGIYVVAEGVETREQLNWLRANGITFGQGYFLGEPKPGASHRERSAETIRPSSSS